MQPISTHALTTAEAEFQELFRNMGDRLGKPLRHLSGWLERAVDRTRQDRAVTRELQEPLGLRRDGLRIASTLQLPRLKGLDNTDQRMQGFIQMEGAHITPREIQQKVMAARTPHPHAPDAYLSKFPTSREGTFLVVDQRGRDLSLALERDGQLVEQSTPFSLDRLNSRLDDYLEKHSLEARTLTHQRTVPARKVFRLFEGLPYMFRPADPAPMSLEVDGQHMSPSQAARALAHSPQLLQDFKGVDLDLANQSLEFSAAVVDKLFTREGDLMHESLNRVRDLHYRNQNYSTDQKSVSLALASLDPSRFELRASDRTAELFLVDRQCGEKGRAFPVEYLEKAFSARALTLSPDGQVRAEPQAEYTPPKIRPSQGMDID